MHRTTVPVVSFLCMLALAGCGGGMRGAVPPPRTAVASSPAVRAPEAYSVTDMWKTLWVSTADHIDEYPAGATGSAAPIATITGFPHNAQYQQGGSGTFLAVGPDGSAYEVIAFFDPVKGSKTKLCVYPSGSNGRTAPDQSVGILRAAPFGIALVSDGIAVGLAHDDGTSSVAVYDFNANGPGAPPLRTIAVPNGSTALAASGNDDLFVAYGDAVAVYPNGSSTPSRTIVGPYANSYPTISAIAASSDGTLYVADRARAMKRNLIHVYAPGADGTATPVHTLAGDANFTPSVRIAVSGTKKLFAADTIPALDGPASARVEVFAPGADGTAAPVRRFTLATGSATGIALGP